MAQIAGDEGSSAPLYPDRKSGVWGQSQDGYGVAGTANQGNGVQGGSIDGFGSVGTSGSSAGVVGVGFKETGVLGMSFQAHEEGWGTPELNFHRITEIGVQGANHEGGGIGVRGDANVEFGFGLGVLGTANSYGVYGEGSWAGVAAHGHDAGLVAWNDVNREIQAHLATPTLAAEFDGNVAIFGMLSKSGGGFRIDHPQDPARKYLSHSFVESPDMKNVYDGVVRLDARGNGIVKLPAWFGALNKDYRYQLTPIGVPAPDLHVAQEIRRNQFKIAGGRAGTKVSWQVTGIRQDAWAEANRIRVEEQKPRKEQNHYLHPEVHGRPASRSVSMARHPKKVEPTASRLGKAGGRGGWAIRFRKREQALRLAVARYMERGLSKLKKR